MNPRVIHQSRKDISRICLFFGDPFLKDFSYEFLMGQDTFSITVGVREDRTDVKIDESSSHAHTRPCPDDNSTIEITLLLPRDIL